MFTLEHASEAHADGVPLLCLESLLMTPDELRAAFHGLAIRSAAIMLDAQRHHIADAIAAMAAHAQNTNTHEPTLDEVAERIRHLHTQAKA